MNVVGEELIKTFFLFTIFVHYIKWWILFWSLDPGKHYCFFFLQQKYFIHFLLVVVKYKLLLSMPSPAPQDGAPETPSRRNRNMNGSQTPTREDAPATPTTRTPQRTTRTPRRETSPSRSTTSSSRTPRREVSPARSTTSSTRTPRKTQATPAKSVTSTVDTPMRWGEPRRDIDGQREIPASPAHSLAPTSPGTGESNCTF